MQAHRWELVAGHPALELCNTLSWRRKPRRVIDRLSTFEEYGPWRDAMEHRFGYRLPPLADRSDLDGLADLRRHVVALLDGIVDERDRSDRGFEVRSEVGSELVEPLADRFRAAMSRAALAPRLPLRWEAPPDGPGAIADYFALQTFDLLSADVSRLRRCDLDECGWFFIDTTRNRSRRWCLPDQCGNISRVRAYARRQRADRAAGA